MKRYRITFLLWLLLWLTVWIFGNSGIGIFVLAASVICVAIDAVLTAFASRHISITLSSPAITQKNNDVDVIVSVQNTGFFSCAKIKVNIDCRNMLTGEVTRKHAWISAGGRSTAQCKLKVVSVRCGKISIEVNDFTVLDAFGIAAFSKAAEEKAVLLVLPELYPAEITVGQQRQPDISSNEYSMHRSGDDPSETFAFREYRPGDKIKNIHWKLSEKIGETTVRELGLPVNNSLLIVLDTATDQEKNSAEIKELLGEVAVSVSSALCEMSFSHDIGWFDGENRQAVLCHISGEEDLTMMMSGLLSAGSDEAECTILERFAKEHDLGVFAHIIVISNNSGVDEIVGSTGITYLSPSIADKEGFYVEV